MTSLLHQIAREARFGWRRLRSAPVFTVFAVISLALGVGVTSAIFSAIQSILWTPISVPEPQQVAVLVGMTPYSNSPVWRGPVISRLDFDDARAEATSFSGLAATAVQLPTMTGDGLSVVPLIETVSGSYFGTLHVGPSLGRVLQPADDQPDAPPVVVLGHRFWQTTFAADPNVVGRLVRIAGRPFEVVGVAAESFGGLSYQMMTFTQAWVSLSAGTSFTPTPASAPEDARRNRAQVSVVGRLAPGRTVQAAGVELGAIAKRLDQSWPLHRRLANGNAMTFARSWTVRAASDINADVNDVQTPVSLIIVGLVALVLVVACTNLANLVLGRGAARRYEFAVRRAMGASRARLVREQLIESVWLAGLGALGAYVVVRVLLVVLALDLPVSQTFVVKLTPTLNGTVLLVAAIAMAASLAVFGFAPALQLSRVDMRSALATEAGAAAPPWRFRRHLISGQVAISAAFFMIAAFGAEVIVAEAQHDSGVDIDRLALGLVDFRHSPWNEARARVAIDTIIQQGRQQPAIDDIAIASNVPYGWPLSSYLNITTLDRAFSASERGDTVELIAGTPGIFHTLGVQIVRGRAFTERDDADSPPVVIVSEELARSLFGTTDVVGRRLLSRQGLAATEAPVTAVTIVAVARDTDTTHLFNRRGGIAYLPLAQHYEPLLVVVARAQRDPAPVVPTLRRIVGQADPDLALTSAGTGPLVLAGLYTLVRILATLSASLAALAMMLSMAGLYGVLTHLMARRTREIGVRVALGADPGRIRRLVIADGMRPVAVGLAFGLLLGVLARLAIRAVYRVPLGPMDALAMAVALLPLIASALLASYLPARRASNIAPSVALREQ